MPASRPHPPRVNPPDLPATLADGTPARHLDAVESRFAVGDLAHASLECCVVAGEGEVLDLTGATLLDVLLDEVRAVTVSLRDSTIRRLTIRGGRIGTLDLQRARIAEVAVEGVRIDYLSLGEARGADLIISGCTIGTLDVPQSELARVAFADTRADELDPRGMHATDVDLRGLDVLSVLDVAALRGCTLGHDQVRDLAPALALAHGIHLPE